MILKLLLLIALSSCQSQRGDQDLGAGDLGDIGIENTKDMTPGNTKHKDDGSSIERIDENKVDVEIFSVERLQIFLAWMIFLRSVLKILCFIVVLKLLKDENPAEFIDVNAKGDEV